jgi:hypothetical protein
MKIISISKIPLVRLLAVMVLAFSTLILPPVIVQGSGTLTLFDFSNYRVFQRDIGGRSKNITISGSYSNLNWSRVEARVLWHGTDTVVVDWTTIDSTPGGGTISGTLTVPQEAGITSKSAPLTAQDP